MIKKRRFKDELYDQFERVGKAVASRRRIELLDVLAQGERTVEELAEETDMPIANASQHLQVLRRARLVETRQIGTRVFYRLAGERVFELLRTLRSVAQERLAEVEQMTRDYLWKRDRLDPVSMADLSRRLRSKDVVVLDVRPYVEYQNGHIAGARSIPTDELEARLAEIPKEAHIVAYCRGPFCVFAFEAVERLRRHGRPARRLDLGYPEWQSAGLPVEHGPEPEHSTSP